MTVNKSFLRAVSLLFGFCTLSERHLNKNLVLRDNVLISTETWLARIATYPCNIVAEERIERFPVQAGQEQAGLLIDETN